MLFSVVVVAAVYVGWEIFQPQPPLPFTVRRADGRHALAAFVDAVLNGEVNGGAPVSSTLLFTAYQNAYGNTYTDPGEVFSKALVRS